MRMSDEAWARLDVPIGLAFLMISGESGSVVALYPSPAGATESEIDPLAWRALREANPQLIGLEADAEALIVNRLADPPQYAIAPIDECYRLVGAIKLAWEGISGGDGPQAAATSFLDELRRAGRRMSIEPAAAAANGTPAPDSPVPEIEVTGVRILPRTAAPTLEFEARIEDPAERPVYTIALTALILIEPAKRSYDDAERERLVELFGAPERWSGTTDNMRWAQAEVLVPSFNGAGSFAIPVAAQLRPRDRQRQVLPRPQRRRGAAAISLQRHDLLRGRRRAPAPQAGPLGHDGVVRHAP